MSAAYAGSAASRIALSPGPQGSSSC